MWFFQKSGSEKVEPNSSTKVKRIEEYGSIKDFINEVFLLPYLTIGGSRNEFWNLTLKDLEIDFRAYKSKKQLQQQEIWLQGLYFKQALESSVLVCGLADRKVVKEMPKYPEMPKTQEQIESEENKKVQTELFVAKMERWKKINNSKNNK